MAAQRKERDAYTSRRNIVLPYFLTGLGFAHHSRESLRVAHSQIGDHLAVDGNPGYLQVVDQAAVCDSIEPRGSINSRNPKPAQITFARAAISVGVPKAFQHGFIRTPKQARACPKLTLGHFQNFAVVFPPVWTSFYTSHFLLSCEPLSAGRPFTCLLVAPSSRN